MAYPMGEAKLEPLRVGFDRRMKLEFLGSDISSDGGLFPYRELDHALELTPHTVGDDGGGTNCMNHTTRPWCYGLPGRT